MKNKLASKSLFNSYLLATLASLLWVTFASAQQLPGPGNFTNLKVGSSTVFPIGDGTFIAEGTHNALTSLALVLPATPATRMLWYPKKAAFRAGSGDATSWSEATMGIYSVAMGYSNVASGEGATSIGIRNTASGSASIAMGRFNSAVSYSIAMGLWNNANYYGSIALGYSNTASRFGAAALGIRNSASGIGSTAVGEGNTANSAGLTVVGSFNKVILGNPAEWQSNDPAFQVGNGQRHRKEDEDEVDYNDDGDFDDVLDEVRSNALTVFKNGNMTLQGSLTLGGTITSAGSPVLTNATLATAVPPTSASWTAAFVARGNVAPLAGQTSGGFLALGSSIASGAFSLASGVGATASGFYSSANGAGTTTASGAYSRASGFNSLASGVFSTANGNTATANGFYSFSNGWGTSAKSSSETVFGRYNLESAPLAGTLGVNGLDGLFRLGNGSSFSRSDALTVLKSGQTTLINKDWKATVVASPGNASIALADPSPSTTDSSGNALVVDGHTVLNGKVTIAVPPRRYLHGNLSVTALD